MNSTKDKFKNERIEYKLLTIAIALAALYFVYRIINNVVIGFGYPREILEPANVSLTNLFLQGKSPYTLSALDWEIPGINYDYPFLTSLLVAAIVKITGCSVLAGHYGLSIFCILATGLIGYRTINQYSETTVAPTLGALLFMFCHWRFGYVSAAPDDFGLLVFLLTLNLAVNPKIKNKPLCCAIGVTISFYIKQYFVFSALGIFVYMLLYSKKEALKFFLYTLGLNVAAGVVVTIFWPLYWTYTILFLYSGCFTGVGFGLSYLFEQMKYLAAIFAALFAILIVGLVMAIRKLKANNEKIRNIKVKENDAMALFIVMIPVMLAPLVFFGRNDGAFVSYFLQLWMPSIVVVTLIVFERMLPENTKEDVINSTAESKSGIKEFILTRQKWIYFVTYVIIALFTVYFGFGKLPLHDMTEEELADWRKAYEIVDEFKNTGDVFYARSLAYKFMEDNGGICVCGHDGEVASDTLELLEQSSNLRKMFPYAIDIINKNQEYLGDVQYRAVWNEYPLVTYEVNGYSMIFMDEYMDFINYDLKDKLNLSVGNMNYEVSFYYYVK